LTAHRHAAPSKGRLLPRRPGPVIDGRPARGPSARWLRRIDRLLVSSGERREAELERRLRELPTPSRANTIAVVSPQGGVGKTTSTFIVGGLLADRARLRTVAVDTDPDFGTLASLAPDGIRSPRTVSDLLGDIGGIHTASDLRRYVTGLPNGLHLLAGPGHPALGPCLGGKVYGELITLLSTFYEVVLLDLGTGVAGELGRFAVDRCDQLVLVTTPEWASTSLALSALKQLPIASSTLLANQWRARHDGLRHAERLLFERGPEHRVTIPHDERLARMLDTGTYAVDALERSTRLAVKEFALMIGARLV
jgi:MinD-like ATPase involved in chromosome partitioning or flagellar assembly